VKKEEKFGAGKGKSRMEEKGMGIVGEFGVKIRKKFLPLLIR